MSESSFLDQLGDSLTDLPSNVVDDVLAILGEFADELQYLDHDDVVRIVGMAVSGAVGAGARHYLERHRPDLEAAVRRAFST
jgi:hypothetical protein